MASLIRSQRILAQIGYFGNFLNAAVNVGDLYQLDDRQFIPLGNIASLSPALALGAGNTVTGTKANLSFTQESNVSVMFKRDAGAPLLSKDEVELRFSKRHSAFVSLREAVITQLQLEPIKEPLNALWKEKGFKRNGRHVLVFETVRAGSGTIIYSQDAGNKVVLRATTQEALTSVTKIGGGAVEFVTNTKATLETISTEPFVALFKALYLKANGRFEILG